MGLSPNPYITPIPVPHQRALAQGPELLKQCMAYLGNTLLTVNLHHIFCFV